MKIRWVASAKPGGAGGLSPRQDARIFSISAFQRQQKIPRVSVFLPFCSQSFDQVERKAIVGLGQIDPHEPERQFKPFFRVGYAECPFLECIESGVQPRVEHVVEQFELQRIIAIDVGGRNVRYFCDFGNRRVQIAVFFPATASSRY